MDARDEVIQQQRKALEEAEDAFREIGNFADGLRSLLNSLLQDVPEGKLVDHALQTIMKIVEQNI